MNLQEKRKKLAALGRNIECLTAGKSIDIDRVQELQKEYCILHQQIEAEETLLSRKQIDKSRCDAASRLINVKK